MLKKHFQTLFFATALILSTNCYSNPDTLAQQTARDFTAVAKKAIPAVVFIQVKGSEKASSSLFDQDESGDLEDLFSNDFFHHFFFNKRGLQQKQPFQGQGSGFIVSPDGYILTNNHMVENANDILVTLNDGRELEAKVVGRDPNTDIAVIKVDAKDLHYVKLGDSQKLDVGEWVIAIGNPYGLQASLTVGVVSAKGRNNLDLANVEDFIQTDAAINRGNSGGPLLNLDGQVIGMNTAIVANMGAGSMGIGFAIPSNMIHQVMDQLIKTGTVSRGFVGISLQALDKDLAQAFNVDAKEGALVAEVAKDSPAEKAGIKQGDIIQEINNQKVTSIGGLRTEIALTSPGKKINFKILRAGKILQIPVEIGTYPTSKPQQAEMSGNKLGFDVQDLTSDVAKTLGVSDEEGVVISKVAPNSPAALAGLKKGALVLAVNHKKIGNVEDFNAALQATQENRPVLLLIKQGDSMRYLSLKIG